MRVLHAAAFGGVTAGGFIPMIAALAERLGARGDELALAVPQVDGASWYPQVRAAGVELHVLATGNDAARLAAAWKPDIAHVHFYGWETAVTRAMWISRARVFWHAHSVVYWDRPSRANPRTLFKYRVVGARVERFVAVSSAIGAELVQLGAPRDRVVTVRNAVDAGRFRPPQSAERAAARGALGLGEEPAILFFGRHPRIKGADVLTAALTAMPRATVIAVATPAATRAELAAVARVVALDRVDDVVPLYWAADTLAVPSRGEGFGLVLLEAALTGLPVVASDLPALREAGEGHAHVRYARSGDPVQLGEGLRDALRGGRADVVAPATDPLAVWAGQIIALYDRALRP
ncbi:MAG TPA: glycosyltransferase family 4 protein [Candidatus Acidoferrum sp.]|nr:glycosyltransferase family 4 protein [Candidatus Acidoferrum sp.]